MATDEQILSVINRMIEDDINGCYYCESHDNLVYCYLGGEEDNQLLCRQCRDESHFDDEGNLKMDEVNAIFDMAITEAEEDEDMTPEELAFMKAILG